MVVGWGLILPHCKKNSMLRNVTQGLGLDTKNLVSHIKGITQLENSFRMDHGDIGWEDVDWNQSGSGYGPMAGSCEHCNEPSGSIKGANFFTRLAIVRSSGRTLLFHGVYFIPQRKFNASLLQI
jgi:hypothetical protein